MRFDTAWNSKRLRDGVLFGLLLSLALVTPLGCGPKPSAPSGGSPTSGPSGGGNVGTDDSYKKSPHLALGNPTGAQESDQNNYLIIRDQYALSYNDSAGHANWVSWSLKSDDLGPVERSPQFYPDQSLPGGFTQITPRDYTKSGYDRGHLCPSGDRTATTEDNDATFLMTNIIPQAGGNNQGPWKMLEDESRDLARSGLNLYIVAGGGGKSKTIGRGKVDVPVFTWKVIAVLPPGKKAPQDINETTRVIAVRMPNISTIKPKKWREFRVSPREIQNEAGVQFFTTVATPVRDVLLNKVDTE